MDSSGSGLCLVFGSMFGRPMLFQIPAAEVAGWVSMLNLKLGSNVPIPPRAVSVTVATVAGGLPVVTFLEGELESPSPEDRERLTAMYTSWLQAKLSVVPYLSLDLIRGLIADSQPKETSNGDVVL